jgi:hypothetical protein
LETRLVFFFFFFSLCVRRPAQQQLRKPLLLYFRNILNARRWMGGGGRFENYKMRESLISFHAEKWGSKPYNVRIANRHRNPAAVRFQ